MRHVLSLVEGTLIPPAAALFVRAAIAVRSAWRDYQQRRRLQHTITSLSALDDRALKDIGLARSEIESVVLTGGRDRHIARI
jgi:uncharacterized protein YjiS (DUF1127 family)